MQNELDWVIGFACGGVVLIIIVFCILCCCIRKQSNKDVADGKQRKRSASSKKSSSSGYTRVSFMEGAESSQDEELDEKEGYFINASPRGKQTPMSVYVAAADHPRHHKNIDSVASYDENIAEPSVSDFESDDVSVSAYGDRASVFSHDSNLSWLQINTSIQMSLIYSREMKYVAGKIIQVDGLGFPDPTKGEVKTHVVVLPVKKYALKTNWYHIKNNKSRMDEYFKFKFKRLPAEGQISFRFRVYGRKKNFSKSTCIGECFVNLREIVTSRGGLTIWRPLSKGAPEAIMEED